jgi:hypothetical protein
MYYTIYNTYYDEFIINFTNVFRKYLSFFYFLMLYIYYEHTFV